MCVCVCVRALGARAQSPGKGASQRLLPAAVCGAIDV
jgi:hypothetical protein